MFTMVFSFLFLLAFVSRGVRAEDFNNQDNEVEDSSNFRVLYRVLTDCSQKSDISVCLKMKAVGFLDRALSVKSPLPVTDYVAVVSDPQATKEMEEERGFTPGVQTEEEIEATLPRSLDDKNNQLDKMLQDRIDSFLQTRTIQLTLPTDLFEGRRRKDKYGGMMMMGGLAFGGMLLQAFMGKIALIAGKALIVAKMALVLSAVVGLKKLLGNSGGHDSQGFSRRQVVYASDHPAAWGRGFSDTTNEPAQEMAYSAQIPESEERDNS